MTRKKVLFLIMLWMLIMSIFPMHAFANSAEPPSLVILINDPPDDLSVVMISNAQQPEATVRRVAWEGYYAFYSRDMKESSQYTFRVTTGGESFQCSIEKPYYEYNNVFTLDVVKQTLTPGTYPFRTAILVFIRLLLTLLIEGFVFWLFQFRSKRSWLVFFTINMITQGVLNIWLISGTSLMPSYLILGLIFGELFVFVAEMVGFSILIHERKRGTILLYVLVANFLSLIAGGYLISLLPV